MHTSKVSFPMYEKASMFCYERHYRMYVAIVLGLWQSVCAWSYQISSMFIFAYVQNMFHSNGCFVVIDASSYIFHSNVSNNILDFRTTTALIDQIVGYWIMFRTQISLGLGYRMIRYLDMHKVNWPVTISRHILSQRERSGDVLTGGGDFLEF